MHRRKGLMRKSSASATATALMLCLSMLMATTGQVQGTEFVQQCGVGQNPPITAIYDRDLRKFVKMTEEQIEKGNKDDEEGDHNDNDKNNNNRQRMMMLRRGRRTHATIDDENDDENDNNPVLPAIYFDDDDTTSVQHHNDTVSMRMLTDGSALYHFRRCPCASPGDSSSYPRRRRNRAAYCPLDKNTCGLTKDATIACWNQSSRTILIRNAWPVVILWYAALVLFIVFTEQGRNARHFAVRKLCKSNLNEQAVERILRPITAATTGRNRPSRINALFPPPRLPPSARLWIFRGRQRQQEQQRQRQQWTLQERAILADPSILIAQAFMTDGLSDDEDGALTRPTELALKTRRYVATSERATTTRNNKNTNDDGDDDGDDDDDDDDDGENTCTICFGLLEDGDRVGALPCEHVFHVDCLKTWLPRRNACPLCAEPAASPRYNTTSTTNVATSGDSIGENTTIVEANINLGNERSGHDLGSRLEATVVDDDDSADVDNDDDDTDSNHAEVGEPPSRSSRSFEIDQTDELQYSRSHHLLRFRR